MGNKSALDFSFTSSEWYKLGAHHWTDAVRSDPPVLFEQALLRPWESEAVSRTRPCFNQESMDWFMGKRIGNTEFFTIKTDVGFFFKEHFKQISDSKAGENCCSCFFLSHQIIGNVFGENLPLPHISNGWVLRKSHQRYRWWFIPHDVFRWFTSQNMSKTYVGWTVANQLRYANRCQEQASMTHPNSPR